MNSAQIQQMAEDIDTAICVIVNSILDDHGVDPIERATICIAIAGLQQGRNDNILGDGDVEANNLFNLFRERGAARLLELKKRSMN